MGGSENYGYAREFPMWQQQRCSREIPQNARVENPSATNTHFFHLQQHHFGIRCNFLSLGMKNSPVKRLPRCSLVERCFSIFFFHSSCYFCYAYVSRRANLYHFFHCIPSSSLSYCLLFSFLSEQAASDFPILVLFFS